MREQNSFNHKFQMRGGCVCGVKYLSCAMARTRKMEDIYAHTEMLMASGYAHTNHTSPAYTDTIAIGHLELLYAGFRTGGHSPAVYKTRLFVDPCRTPLCLFISVSLSLYPSLFLVPPSSEANLSKLPGDLISRCPHQRLRSGHY